MNRLRTNAQSNEVCSEQPFTHSCSKLQSMYGAIVYSGMLEAPKFVRSNIFLCYALNIEVSTAADQPVYSVSNARSIKVCSEQSPFTQSCSEHRSVHGANVYSVLLGASKFARSNRLLRRARSIEVCTPMHGATIYSDVLGASRVCMDKSFFNNVRPNFCQLSFPLLFSISAIKMRISAILSYSKHARVLQSCLGHFVFIDTEHA